MAKYLYDEHGNRYRKEDDDDEDGWGAVGIFFLILLGLFVFLVNAPGSLIISLFANQINSSGIAWICSITGDVVLFFSIFFLLKDKIDRHVLWSFIIYAGLAVLSTIILYKNMDNRNIDKTLDNLYFFYTADNDYGNKESSKESVGNNSSNYNSYDYSNNNTSNEIKENVDEKLSNEARYSWLMDKWEGDYNNNKIVIEFVSGGNLYVNDRHYGTYKIQNEGNVNIYHGQQIYCYQRGANSYAFTISIKDKKLILNDSYLEKVSTNTDTYEEVESDYDSNDIPNGTYFANEKAFFYNEADENTKRKAYLAEGDIVSIQNTHNGFGYVSFTNSEGATTNGWIKISKLSSVGEYHVYEKVEEMPQFPGGERELMTFLSQNIKYPTNAQEQGIQGTVVLRFVVGKEGLITNVTVMRSLDATCDREAERVIRSMPKWIPGKQNGNPILVYYTLPIRFQLSN